MKQEAEEECKESWGAGGEKDVCRGDGGKKEEESWGTGKEEENIGGRLKGGHFTHTLYMKEILENLLPPSKGDTFWMVAVQVSWSIVLEA